MTKQELITNLEQRGYNSDAKATQQDLYTVIRRSQLFSDTNRLNAGWARGKYVLATYEESHTPIDSYIDQWKQKTKNYTDQVLCLEVAQDDWHYYDHAGREIEFNVAFAQTPHLLSSLKINLKKGDKFDNGKTQLLIIDEDKLCYEVQSTFKGTTGVRTISKKLLAEFIDYFKKNPSADGIVARNILSGKSDRDKFEYGYYATLKIMALMAIKGVQLSVEIDDEIFKDSASDDLPLQKIFYGAPGTGKSHEVKKRTGELLSDDTEVDLPNVFRTTFHPDTDYASFVGCYKPTMKPTSKEQKTISGKEEDIAYEFVPQVFADAYIYAYNNSKMPTYLVIEEINRGNCAQIFGDLFQLLDRKNGISEYKIKADNDFAKYLEEAKDENGQDILLNKDGIKDRKLCLPANLHILATMNTSDQSLFPMDSAFKRRWEWEYVPINYDTNIKSGEFEITIDKLRYSWVDFIKNVNAKIFDLTQSEDKQMGNFFIKNSINKNEFKSKVMFYLWYEVLRDEVGNKDYFFYAKSEIDGKESVHKFTFKDLFESNANDILTQFMAYLGVSSK